VVDGFEHDVMVTLPDFRVVQSVFDKAGAAASR
jgi:hypothetical protein